ncbi:diaminopimelate decarboxylase family protein [Streptomyces sp. SBT349]|uniref:diaminopimelate decarboxylase family protein n=1 Tax=Streptomyces sp. SBT349 TaxID=1580539 RepID=UPI00066C313C|nr:hypothetical protein [Streptomyces sp. SBT349]
MDEVSTDIRLRGLSPQELRKIDSVLPYTRFDAGRLHAYGTPADALWSGGHPAIVFFPQRAVENYRDIRRAFARHFGSSMSVHFALKSCYVPSVLRALRAAGAGVEVMSPFEWRLARRHGFAPDSVVANAVRRDESSREDLLGSGAGLIGIDGREELDALCATARRLGVRPDVTIRISAFATGTFFGGNSKLGTPVEDAAELVEAALRSPDVGTVGVHGHQLRKCVDPEQFGAFAGILGDLATDVSTDRRPVGIINLGGGLESRSVLERTGVTCDDFADAARDGLRRTRPGLRLVLEPGRHLVSDAAIAFTRILGTKHTAGTRWAITEIGTNVLAPFSDRAYPPVPLRWEEDGSWHTYHVSDGIAVPEVLCLNAPLPDSVLASGLALLDCGAYTTTYSELWGCDLPDLAVFEEGAVRRVFGPEERARMLASLYGDADAGPDIDPDADAGPDRRAGG